MVVRERETNPVEMNTIDQWKESDGAGDRTSGLKLSRDSVYVKRRNQTHFPVSQQTFKKINNNPGLAK